MSDISISEDAAGAERRQLYPVRIRIEFVDGLDAGDLEFLGLEFTNKIDVFLKSNIGDDSKLVWIDSTWGSLNNFNLLQVDLSNVLGDTFAEYQAAKFITETISDCLSKTHFKKRIRRFVVGSGGPIRPTLHPLFSRELVTSSESYFAWQKMEVVQSRDLSAEEGAILRSSENLAEAFDDGNASNTKLIASAASVLLVLALLVWNIIQAYQQNSIQNELLQSARAIRDKVSKFDNVESLDNLETEENLQNLVIELHLHGVDDSEKLIIREEKIGNSKILKISQ